MREYTNNASAQLASGINDSVTALAVQTGQGARFPSIAGAPTHFMATLVDSANNIEIIKVTARAGDAFSTIVRGQEGTVARAYTAGDRVDLRQTAGGHNTNLQIGQVRNMAVAGGTVDAITAAFPNSTDAALENGMRFCVQATGANGTTTPTLNATLGSTATGAKTIVKKNNLSLQAGDIPGADYPCDFQYDASLDKYVLMNPAAPFPAGTMMYWPSETVPSWALVRDGAAISRTTYADLFGLVNHVINGTTTNASAVVTGLSSTKRLFVGMKVEGSGIPAGATVASIQSSSQFTLSANASASATVPLRFFPFGSGDGSATFNIMNDLELFERGSEGGLSHDQTVIIGTTTNASPNVTGLSSTVGLYVGMGVTAAAGIPGSTTIAAITSATAITLSANATATGARDLTFTGRQFTSEQADDFESHRHPNMPSGTLNAQGGSNAIGNTSNGFTGFEGGAETRPRNRAYLPIIAY